uniref:Doublesex- and mab-3-related transcription factor C1/C2 C-terminal domain-containing protein n=1 Tax=Oryctolagus cuniculus TaxID=9986 RepID=A0A5F9CAT9_RABIT
MTIAPGVPVYINNMAMGAGIHTGKVNIIPQPQAYPCYISNQVPKASEQALVVASEWERRLEAAEALLALRDSIPTPPDPRPLAQPCGLPAPAGERTLPFVPTLCPRVSTSNSLPIGYLRDISLS